MDWTFRRIGIRIRLQRRIGKDLPEDSAIRWQKKEVIASMDEENRAQISERSVQDDFEHFDRNRSLRIYRKPVRTLFSRSRSPHFLDTFLPVFRHSTSPRSSRDCDSPNSRLTVRSGDVGPRSMVRPSSGVA